MQEQEIFPFEETEIYEKSYDFARKCRKIVFNLPTGYRSDADQLKRASLSVCNNFTEGYGRWHINDKKQFYTIAKGSAYECIPVISFLTDESQITEKKQEELRHDVGQITRMLSALIQGLTQRKTA